MPLKEQRQLSEFGVQPASGSHSKPYDSTPTVIYDWFHKDTYYGCSCGGKHGTHSEKLDPKHQIPWPDVGCPAWVHVVTVHRKDDPKIFAFQQITGFLEHSAACTASLIMDSDPCIPLHPDEELPACTS
ncbi:hypothetical protein EDD18DRAFT_1363723 [Armillaria luteobubalina]|uniref:Uncharacterized protein n=1 Tax=Armillaria luteobubalina TaxID=153913 RepID=A0AA39PAT2_9AGAR|nr:hypothetical protein EDD18DRAFT_1363723 [Armillaria luteobubalina]